MDQDKTDRQAWLKNENMNQKKNLLHIFQLVKNTDLIKKKKNCLGSKIKNFQHLETNLETMKTKIYDGFLI